MAADVDTVWNASLAADLIELGRWRPVVRALGFLRAAPELVTNLFGGRGFPAIPEPMTLLERVVQVSYL